MCARYCQELIKARLQHFPDLKQHSCQIVSKVTSADVSYATYRRKGVFPFKNVFLNPVFDWMLRLRLILNATQNETSNMKSSCPMQTQLWHTQRQLYSTGLRWGFALGVTHILGFALGNANFRVCVGFARLFRYQHVGIPNAKFSRWGFCPMRTSNVMGYALQWNIGLMLYWSRREKGASEEQLQCNKH